MVSDNKGFLHPFIHKDKCVECGLCDGVCEHVNQPVKKAPLKIVALKHWDDVVRSTSSSGGAFMLMASEIINRGGVVYGAVFDDSWEVRHRRCTDSQGLKEMQGSKYVQSNLDNSFRHVEQDLRNGIIVLFTGTPCQCGGLKEYLKLRKADDENLFLCDLICHGIPSPLVWGDYVKYRSENKKLAVGGGINFRDKRKSWRDFRMCLTYSDESSCTYRQNEDFFFIMFFHHLILRESCFECKFTSLDRVSDITIGDFWGLEESYPEFDDDRGTSVMLLNSDKGLTLFDSVKDNCFHISITKEALTKRQPNLRRPSPPNPKYELFWDDYKKMSFNEILKRYADRTAWGIFKRKYLFKFLYYTRMFPILVSLKKMFLNE